MIKYSIGYELSSMYIPFTRCENTSLKECHRPGRYAAWDFVRNDGTEESRASIIRVTRIGELGTMLAVISKRRTLRVPSSPIRVTLMMEALRSSET
jgi:hypothetical protein